MALQSENPVDSTDWKILRELQQDARLSYNELGDEWGCPLRPLPTACASWKRRA